MWTEAELPDWDFESVYGPEALSVRISARLDELSQRFDDQLRRLKAMNLRPVTPAERDARGA